MNELITIIINVYNGEKYVKKCLDSVINQTYKNLEILIINDGSTDNTLKKIKECKDKRIRIITTENQGLALSRNVGIDNAKGDYLYFVDVDDFIEKDTIEYLYRLIKQYKADMATCDSVKIKSYDYKNKEKEEAITLFTGEEMLKKNLLEEIRYSTCIWNKLMKKDLLNNLRFEDRIINDLSLVYKIFINSKKIVYSNQTKYYYYINSDSVSIKKREDLERLICLYNVELEKYNNILKEYPNMTENKIALLSNITTIYIRKNKDFHKYLKEKKVVKLYKKTFNFKILKTKMNKKLKLRLLAFRMSPKTYKFLANIYLKIK